MGIIKVGETYLTNRGYTVDVVEYVDAYNIKVKFREPLEHTRWCRSGDLRKGKVANLLERVYYGVGYCGYGKYLLKPNDDKRCGNTWMHMLERCYDKVRQPIQYKSYIGCSVDERWHCYQDFAKFYHEDIYRKDNWQLDKDLIVPNNKVYGPDTCAFVPQEINKILTLNISKRGKYLIGVSMVKPEANKSRPYYARVVHGDEVISSYFKSEIEAHEFYKFHKESIIAKKVSEYDGKIDPKVLEALSKWRVPNE